MLLPAAVHFGSGVRAAVATDGDGLIVGAAALSARPRADPVSGLRVALHVIPPRRGRGLGRALSEACADVARGAGAEALYAWGPVDPAAGEPWRRLGFGHSCTVRESRVSLAAALNYLTPFYERVVAEGWIPPDARLVPLDRADAREVARLHVAQLGGELESLVRRISGNVPPPYHPAMSPVILVNGRVMAFSLALPLPGGIALAESTVVDPSLRGGWANLWLKIAGATESLRLGLHTLLYYTYDRHTDTRKLGRQVGGVTRELVEPYKLLG